MLIRKKQYEVIADLIENELSYRERRIFLDALGIQCLNCGSVCEPRSKEDICADFELGRNQTVDNVVLRVGGRLRERLREQGW